MMMKSSVVLITFLSVSPAFAYDWLECWATTANMKWSGGSSETYKVLQDTMSSSEESDVTGSFDQWNRIRDSKIDINYSLENDNDGKIEYYDSRNEVGVVTDSSFYADHGSSVAAATSTDATYNFVTGDCNISDIDIVIPETSTSDTDFVAYIVHEAGHSIGVDHGQDYGMMLATWASADHNGTYPFKPLPDDVQAVNVNYSNSGAANDVSTSKYELVRDTSISTDTDEQYILQSYYSDNYFTACPGDTIEPLVTNLNFGDSSVSLKNKFFLSTSSSGSSPITITTLTTSFGAHTEYTRTLSMALPRTGLSYGTLYYLFGYFDSDSALSENDETNNKLAIGNVIISASSDCTSGIKVTRAIDFSVIAARATSYKLEKFKNIIKNSLVIALATVKSRNFTENENNLYTTYSLEVKEGLRGTENGSTLSLKVFGGLKEGSNAKGEQTVRSQHFSHTPLLESGKTYLLFLDGVRNDPFMGGKNYVYQQVSSGDTNYLLTLEGAKFYSVSGENLTQLSTNTGCTTTTCKDLTSTGKSAVKKLYTRSEAGKSRLQNEFIEVLKTYISQNQYTGNFSALSSALPGTEIATKQVD